MSKKVKKREGTFKRAIELLEAGYSTRGTIRQLRAEGFGADTNMVMAAYELADVPDCACGRPNGHKGWCSERVKKSPKRQAYLNRVRKSARQRAKAAAAI
jgi:hypothetical protein